MDEDVGVPLDVLLSRVRLVRARRVAAGVESPPASVKVQGQEDTTP